MSCHTCRLQKVALPDRPPPAVGPAINNEEMPAEEEFDYLGLILREFSLNRRITKHVPKTLRNWFYQVYKSVLDEAVADPSNVGPWVKVLIYPSIICGSHLDGVSHAESIRSQLRKWTGPDWREAQPGDVPETPRAKRRGDKMAKKAKRVKSLKEY